MISRLILVLCALTATGAIVHIARSLRLIAAQGPVAIHLTTQTVSATATATHRPLGLRRIAAGRTGLPALQVPTGDPK